MLPTLYNPSPFKVSRYSGKDEVMPEETVLKCYQVGDFDYVAATNEDEARKVLAEMNGDDPTEYADWDADLVGDAKLDKKWVDEDPPHAECG